MKAEGVMAMAVKRQKRWLQFQTSVTRKDRAALEFIQERYGYQFETEAARQAIRQIAMGSRLPTERQAVIARSADELAKAKGTSSRIGASTSPSMGKMTLWLSEAERSALERVKAEAGLEKLAEALRYAIRCYAEQLGFDAGGQGWVS
jgi:hypothetical protein